MAINFPTSLDTFTNPTSASALTTDHALQHSNINDAVEALEAKVAIGNTVLGTYTAYTPSFSNGVTIGDGVISGAYCRVNDFVHVYGKFTFGSTSAITSTVIGALPVNVNSAFTNDAAIYGIAQYRDISTNAIYTGVAHFAGNNTVFSLRVQLAGGTYLTQSGVTGSAPFTWATGDFMAWNLYYRAA